MQDNHTTTLLLTSREGRVLKFRMFTGYTTACFLEGTTVDEKIWVSVLVGAATMVCSC